MAALNPRAMIELVRAPAALTVLGDTIAGAAAAGVPLRGRRMLLPLASVALYWAGMALNDWADRAVDSKERPERPIPSGRVEPDTALGTAICLTAAGIGIAAAAGGLDAVAVAVPLAASVWAYDTVLKDGPGALPAMAACRGLDVLLGAGLGNAKRALPAAATMAVHTLSVTALSRGEVHGGDAETAAVALGGTALSAVGALVGRAASWRHRVAGVAAAAAYAGFVGRAQADAVTQPDAGKIRSATKAGVHGMVLLQSALTARRRLPAAIGVAAALPIARALGRKVSPT
ncbi:MAG TPA: UbiA family prenyltransferase [Actinokineospora sp.]|nr:UbiA family prenyltransferase [Actinokineospora sp.]